MKISLFVIWGVLCLIGLVPSRGEDSVSTNAPVASEGSELQTAQPKLSTVDEFLWQHKDSTLQMITNDDAVITDEYSKRTKLWTVYLESSGLTIFAHTKETFPTDPGKDSATAEETLSIDLGDVESLASVLNKFLEWEGIARTNKVENFEKEIAWPKPDKRPLPDSSAGLWSGFRSVYTFRWMSGRANLEVAAPTGETNHFDKDDILELKKYLKMLPDLKKQLAADIATEIRKQERQNALFK